MQLKMPFLVDIGKMIHLTDQITLKCNAIKRGIAEKWKETVENVDFTHSSQNRWCLHRRLGLAVPPDRD
ncbi:hypothetical protein J437_LFUL016139 [Ladona fulva]|uniref:Uncharacterized protein n=1 Tax=Ladona fulva TaxID=123851 RepID=A0A8K0PBH2_LADFU|nr:hypothetical protein J437_LFUL016139 [Ladona fulva]